MHDDARFLFIYFTYYINTYTYIYKILYFQLIIIITHGQRGTYTLTNKGTESQTD